MRQVYTFSGMWHSRYRAQMGSEQRLTVVEHDCIAYQQGEHLIIETLPGTGDSYLLARFTVDGRILTGTYHSQNTPETAAQEAAYYGAAQLILSEDGATITGKAVGFGRSMVVKVSDWQLTRVQNAAALRH